MTRKLIVDASFIIAIFADIRLPWLFDKIRLMGCEILITSYVMSHELKSVGVREAVMNLIADKKIRLVDVNTLDEIWNFGKKHGDLNLGESDLLLTFQKKNGVWKDMCCVIDEKKARAMADKLEIPYIGLLGLLKELKKKCFITGEEVKIVNERIDESNFYVPRGFSI